MTDALMFEESVHTDTIGTWGGLTQVHLDVTPLSREAAGTITAEIMNKISAVGIQEAWDVSTVVDVDLTKATFPARLTLAAEASLFQWYTDGIIVTRVALLRAWVDSDVTVGTCVPRATKAFVRVTARVVLAHGTVRASILHTLSLLILALHSTVSFLTLTAVTLREVDAGTTIVAGL